MRIIVIGFKIPWYDASAWYLISKGPQHGAQCTILAQNEQTTRDRTIFYKSLPQCRTVSYDTDSTDFNYRLQ